MPDNRDRRTDQLENALRGMLLCFDSLSDADVSALGMKRSSACVMDARRALDELPTQTTLPTPIDIPDDEADAYLQAVHEADMGDGHGHAPEDCPDRGMYE